MDALEKVAASYGEKFTGVELKYPTATELIRLPEVVTLEVMMR